MKAAGPDIRPVDTGKCPVEVTLVRDAGTQALQVKVSVRSKMRPASIMEGLLPGSEIRSMADIRHKVEVLAGALAEEICRRLGDVLLDPDEMAKLAGKEWDELMKKTKSEVGI